MVKKREIKDDGRKRGENSYNNVLYIAVLFHGDISNSRRFFCFSFGGEFDVVWTGGKW
jgi:hypothetical protein